MISLPFQEWFTFHHLIGGDFRLFWPENLAEIINYTYAWDSSLNTGLGKDNFHILWLNSYLGFGGHFLTQILKIPWEIAEKILFFWPIILLSFFSAFFLSKTIIKNTFFNILAGFLFLTNTYALMIFGGGQLGVGLAYSVTPFVLLSFMRIIDSHSSSEQIKLSIWAAMMLSIQILFDPRIAVLYIFIVAIYFLFQEKRFIKNVLFVFIIPVVLAILLHAFWIFPTIIGFFDIGISTYPTISTYQFFSFANFSNAMAMLHPNWPENIFGKVYFMRSEFLLLPILAFSSLLFLKSNIKNQISKIKYQKYILFFALLGLLGTFLAKGANEPFGNIYFLLSYHVPGFIIFRDPTKFYILVAVAYSVLIPFSVSLIYNRLSEKWQTQKYIPNIFLLFISFYFLFLLRPAFMGEVKGTFTQHTVPNEYTGLKDFLKTQPEFFRTLWIPQLQRFGYFSSRHPAISKNELLTDSKGNIAEELKKQSTMELLNSFAVKYVIIPFDSEGEIFLEDRKYSDKHYKNLVEELKSVATLKEVKKFGKIVVFETSDYQDRFWMDNAEQITWTMINPTSYKISIEPQVKGRLIFSEKYSPRWMAKENGVGVSSQMYKGMFNSFPINSSYGEIQIEYEPQKWLNIGWIVSIFSLISAIFVPILSRRTHKLVK